MSDQYGLGKYAQLQAMPETIAVMTLRERLIDQKKSIEKRLQDVNSALDFLDKNPNFEEFHNLIGRTGY